MYVVAIDSETAVPPAISDHTGSYMSPAHPIKVYQQAEKDLVCDRTILEDTLKVRLDGDGGNITCVKAQDGGRMGDGVSRGGEDSGMVVG